MCVSLFSRVYILGEKLFGCFTFVFKSVFVCTGVRKRDSVCAWACMSVCVCEREKEREA